VFVLGKVPSAAFVSSEKLLRPVPLVVKAKACGSLAGSVTLLIVIVPPWTNVLPVGSQVEVASAEVGKPFPPVNGIPPAATLKSTVSAATAVDLMSTTT